MDSTPQPQSLAGYDNERQTHTDNMSVSNNLNVNTASQQHRPIDESDLELRQHTAATHPYHSNFASASNLRMSTASLADHSASSMGTQQHQYHYIQYPHYYYHIGMQAQRQQQKQQQQESFLGIPEVACHCHCSCGAQQQQQLLSQYYYQQRKFSASSTAIGQTPPGEEDSSKIVVQVHCQSNGETECEREHERAMLSPPTKTQSEQSLLNHSYQTLQLQSATEEKPLNVLRNSKLNISCDCDLECTCGAERLRTAAAESAAKHASKPAAGDDDDLNADVLDTRSPLKNQKQCQIEAMLGADEITVSESDNNSTMIKKKKKTGGSVCAHTNNEMSSWCHHERNSPLTAEKNCDCHYNSSHIEIYSDGDSKGGNDSIDDQRPPLPPRPPPPPRLRNATVAGNGVHRHGSGIKKYVVWCLICGGFSCLLGILFLGVYFLLHSYTITVGNFETVPTFVPATLLILTGLCIISLARRRNRYSYLIKLSGVCGLISALTCALVTVTTTVLHMSRLQALRECEYAQKTRTCTCYSDMIESQVDRVDKGVRLVFDSLSDCGVVHGSLYSCLRAIFGLSVAGVLVAVFSCMLVYQLLSHERKKMYWEQLELRCRSLYTSQQGPPPNLAAMTGSRGPICRCCEQCHLHRQVPLQTTAYPWDDSSEPRFWTGQPPGNFYSPNPGGDDLHMTNAGTACRGHGGTSGARSRMTGWSWPRMPWQRNSPVPSTRQFRQTPSSPDSQYGFTNNAPTVVDNMMVADSETAPAVGHGSAAPPFNVVGGALPYGVWGPPPPYSDPNSPARRGYYQYIQPNLCGNISAAGNNITHSGGNMANEGNISTVATEQRMPCLNHRSVFLEQQPHQLSINGGNCCPTASMRRNLAKRRTTGGNGGGGSGDEDAMKSKTGGGEYENTPSESDGCNMRDRFSNTLPTRKVKKRNDTNMQANIVGNTNPQPAPRLSMQQVSANTDGSCTNEHTADTVLNDDDCMEQITENMCDKDKNLGGCASSCVAARATLRRKRGIENSGFQSNSEGVAADKIMVESEADAVVIAADMHIGGDPAESEVYFADVSSCCNMSLKNDNYYDEAHQIQHHVAAHHHHQHQNSNCSQNSSSNNEDYLAQRFGPRENSIRSRLPFPQSRNNDYEENLNTPHQKEIGGSITPVNQMQKEISRQSMCSVESEAQTDCTDLSPATPCSNKFAQANFEGKLTTTNNDDNDASVPQCVTGAPLPNFIAKFPYSSESQSLEAHRRSTKDIHDLIISSEAHYEVINDNPQPTPPPCQFTAQQPTTRINKPQPQRPTNLSTSKSKTKQSVKSRDRIEANVLPSERDWSIPSGVGNVNKGVVVGVGGGGGGNSNERKCL